MNKQIKSRLAILGMVILLASCNTEEATQIKPLYDVTFTGINDFSIGVTETKVTNGLQEFVDEKPDDLGSVLTMGVYGGGSASEQYFQEFYGNEIPDSVKVPALPAGEYNTYFSTWGYTIYDYLAFSYPLYLWRAVINPEDKQDYNVEMELISGKFNIEIQEGQTLDESLYERFEIVYSLNNINQTNLYSNTDYNYGTDYSYAYENSIYYKSDQYYWPTQEYHFMPNEFKMTAIKLYDTQGILIKTIELDQTFTVEKGKHTILTVDVDKLCNVCEPCTGDSSQFLITWENVNWTQEIIELN